MELAQRIEMNEAIREYKRKGQPEIAAIIKENLDKGIFALSDAPEPVELVPAPKRTAKKVAWQDWAKENTDLDLEVIEAVTRGDLITMLEVNGFIASADNE